MSPVTLPRLTSLRHKLDTSPDAFGELRESTGIVNDGGALRARMKEDGYIFLRDYLDHDEVMDARSEVVKRLAAQALIDTNHPLMDAVTAPGKHLSFSRDLGNQNPPLAKVLYAGRMIEFHTRLLGGPVRHFDYTWFRAISGGNAGTNPHCDIVYMGRGTKNLYTSWTPIGDAPYELGGLMVLEDSHKKTDLLKNYISKDVDAYCKNRPDAPEIESGKKTWQFNGVLSTNPVQLRAKLGGRLLTTEYRAGDLLVFSMFTVHASLDNQSNRFRLSSDSRYQLASEPADDRWIGENPVAHGVAGKRGRIC